MVCFSHQLVPKKGLFINVDTFVSIQCKFVPLWEVNEVFQFFFQIPCTQTFRVRFFSKSPVPKLSENYQASLKSRENCVFTLTDWGVACCTDHTASPVHSLHPPPSAQCTTHICCWLFSSWLRITHWKHRHARNGRHSSRLCMPHSSFQSLSFSILTLQLNVGLACSKCDWRLTHLTFLLVVSVFMLSKCSLLLSVSSVFERWCDLSERRSGLVAVSGLDSAQMETVDSC